MLTSSTCCAFRSMLFKRVSKTPKPAHRQKSQGPPPRQSSEPRQSSLGGLVRMRCDSCSCSPSGPGRHARGAYQPHLGVRCSSCCLQALSPGQGLVVALPGTCSHLVSIKHCTGLSAFQVPGDPVLPWLHCIQVGCMHCYSTTKNFPLCYPAVVLVRSPSPLHVLCRLQLLPHAL